jgi:hypothetical protein
MADDCLSLPKLSVLPPIRVAGEAGAFSAVPDGLQGHGYEINLKFVYFDCTCPDVGVQNTKTSLALSPYLISVSPYEWPTDHLHRLLNAKWRKATF